MIFTKFKNILHTSENYEEHVTSLHIHPNVVKDKLEALNEFRAPEPDNIHLKGL